MTKVSEKRKYVWKQVCQCILAVCVGLVLIEDFESDCADSTTEWNFPKVVFRKRWQLILEFIYVKRELLYAVVVVK